MRMTDNMTQSNFSGFQFSGVRVDALRESAYTLAELVIDKTGSVIPFADLLFKIKSQVVEACRKSSRADMVLLRVVEFNTQVTEVHGFLPLSQINPADYQTPQCGGLTALNDAAFSAVGAMHDYGKTLSENDYTVNGILIVVTDGANNTGRTSTAEVKAEIQRALKSEHLESFKTILVAVNAQDADNKKALEDFQAEVGVDEYLDIGDATPGKIAKLGDFVSRSLTATSQSLGTGGPSQALNF